ncbi:transporter substrate-binding domain-containing protein [Hoeflea sp. G2-23]|uniref:Transporter substrate-binding domain-containing protein n=1 Tax=Hoeflea algicola TaxID=2983763 RepID=A0ABT3Z9P5_9HYPH|nr:transporter substrate-binding domain-containing protein [Hoeflea algicola]MCY0148507.1 transporter substrate-binding domain-containing protein [Hoeflea algicola]
MHSFKVRIGAVLAASTLGLLASVTASSADTCGEPGKSTLQIVQERGVLRAGVRPDFPPIGSVDSTGKIVGFGADIAREFAKHLGVEVEFIQTTSSNRFPNLLTCKTDADFGATTATKVRDEQVDFVPHYAWDVAVILVQKGQPTDPNVYLKDADAVVCSTQGGIWGNVWKEKALEMGTDTDVKLYREEPDIVLAMASGKCDIAPIALNTAQVILGKLGEQAANVVIGGEFQKDANGLFVRENDSDWRDWLNWGQQRLYAEGRFQELYVEHFGYEPSFVPWEQGMLQPQVMEVAKEGDKW